MIEIKNILSLFDGISCGQIALNRLNIKYDNYIASEIDKYAKLVTAYNYPNTIDIGNIINIDYDKLPKIDLLIGGSPCQSFSFAGKMKGMSTIDSIKITTYEQYIQLKNDGYLFEGQSYLFWEYIHALKVTKPKYFLLENVVMKKEWEDVITATLGVKAIKINSRLVSAQSRPRLYWTNIPNVTQPEDKNITLADVLEDDADIKYKLSDAKVKRVLEAKRCKGFFYNKTYDKCSTFISGYYKQPTDGIYIDLGFKRRLTPTECEKLQTLPLNYTSIVSDSQRYKMIGNGWTVDVIAHILSFIK